MRCMLVNLDGVIAVVVAGGWDPGWVKKGLSEAGRNICGRRRDGGEGRTEAEAAWVDLDQLIPLLVQSFK
ncbi:MAG: hypothetical protein QHH02_08935 [Syntrophomonadaceae bacterium]|nr:hypothetical protein [Syntrophomonadaceae bacterium]